MDDKTFDQEAAATWIASVEGAGARIRDEDIFPRLRAWIDLCSPVDVLDIGCGQGVCSNKIDLKNRRYIGVDPSSFMVDRANELYLGPSSTFVVGNAYMLPFADSSFDAAFSISVWHLLEDLPRAAAELARVLRARGSFLIITANPDAYSLWTERYTDAHREGRRFQGRLQSDDGTWSNDTLYLHSTEEIIASVRAGGLHIEGSDEFRASAKAPGQHQYLSIHGRKV